VPGGGNASKRLKTKPSVRTPHPADTLLAQNLNLEHLSFHGTKATQVRDEEASKRPSSFEDRSSRQGYLIQEPRCSPANAQRKTTIDLDTAQLARLLATTCYSGLKFTLIRPAQNTSTKAEQCGAFGYGFYGRNRVMIGGPYLRSERERCRNGHSDGHLGTSFNCVDH
jgi:hypothetical protein